MHASICDQLHDVVQNAWEAGASEVVVQWEESNGWHEITVKDNGCGMDKQTLAEVLDPFYTDGSKHRHRRVGLGLAFLQQMVKETDGQLSIHSQEGVGTTVCFRLDEAHVDMPPLGDVVQSLVGLMGFSGDYEVRLERSIGKKSYSVRRSELQEALGDLTSATSLGLMRDYIASQEEALQKG